MSLLQVQKFKMNEHEVKGRDVMSAQLKITAFYVVVFVQQYKLTYLNYFVLFVTC